MRVLIAGGCGFIGSAFARELLKRPDAEILNLDCLNYAAQPVAPLAGRPIGQYRHVLLDIVDTPKVLTVLREFRPEAVINFAAESHVDRSIVSSQAFLHSNVLGTDSLLRACTDYWHQLPTKLAEEFRYLQVSTDEVYGDRDGLPAATVSSAYRPSSPYAASKAAADHLVQAWYRTYGLPMLLTQCSNNYGPWQHPEKLIPLAIQRAVAGMSIPVYGDGQQSRDWLHVEDHVSGLIAALGHGRPGVTYTFAGKNPRSNLALLEQICQMLDQLRARKSGRAPHQTLLRHVADRPGHDRHYRLDDSITRQALDWQPTVAFEQGLLDTVRWYLQNPPTQPAAQ